MHTLFSEWYHATSIDVDDEELKKRWRGVDNYVKKINTEQALDLVRVFYDKAASVGDFNEKFGGVIQKADSTFRIRNNGLEVRLLAGAAIVRSLGDGSSKLNDVLSLAISCAICRGLISNDSGMHQDVVDAAKNYLVNEAKAVRSSDEMEFSGSSNEKLSASIESFKEAFAQPPLSSSKVVLAKPLELLEEEFASQSKALEKLEYELRIQREESNMTWWVIGEYSNDLNMAFATRRLAEVCLIAAKELADLTQVIPGPRSAPALLDKVLRLVTPTLPSSVTLKEAINSSPIEWRKDWSLLKGMEAVSDFCPVHMAVQKSAEETGDWSKSFASGSSIKAIQKFAPLDLALQTYNEELLIKAANDQ